MSESGFGTSENGYGGSPWGRAGFTYSGVYKAIPEEYRVRDKNEGLLLRKIFDGLAKSLDPLVLQTDRFPLLRSPDDIPIELIDELAQDFGIVTDQELSNRRRRGEVTHAVRWFLLKGRKKAYIIIGALFGYIVTVDNVYADDCDTGTLVRGNHKWLALYDEVPADVIPTDKIMDDPLDIYPYPAWPEKCPSHSLCLTIRRPTVTAPINAFQTVLKIVDRIKKTVKPIHVDLFCLKYIEILDVTWDIDLDFKIIVKLKNNINIACYYDIIAADVMETDQCLQAFIQPICTYLNIVSVPWSCFYDVTEADVMITDNGAICPEILPVLPTTPVSPVFSEEFDVFP